MEYGQKTTVSFRALGTGIFQSLVTSVSIQFGLHNALVGCHAKKKKKKNPGDFADFRGKSSYTLPITIDHFQYI